MTVQFAHLNIHTEYSVVDSIIRIPALCQLAQASQIPALALTDHVNLFAAVKFYRGCVAAGIKPIIGAHLLIENTTKPTEPTTLLLLSQNEQGYKNLTRLVSKAYTDGQQTHQPVVAKDWLSQESLSGLIALSGAQDGELGQDLLSGKTENIEQTLQYWQGLMPDRFYIEIRRIGAPAEHEYNHAAIRVSNQYQVPLVATNAVRFLVPDDFEAHEARVCIHDGNILADPNRPKRYTEQQYCRSPEEMVQAFADLPEALENTVEIAKRCNLEMTFGNVFLPNFPVPDGKTIADYFREQSACGLQKRMTLMSFENEEARENAKQQYAERLQLELDVIIEMGFPGYFLIVADFIRWAKEHDIPVGPGRGSGAGSIVAYALEITDLDPIVHELLFERFLNPERVSMPDFDIDFCMDRRDEVIEYVAEKYGRQSVSQIITYGSMAAKAVVRDVGRVLGHPYGFVDKVAKLIPFELGMTLDKALSQEALLQQRYDEEEEVQSLIDLAKQLEGLIRNAGKHAGGVVISPSLLTDFVPIYCERGSDSIVAQFDKDDIETVGLVKFDFLGLRTLTIIDWTVQSVNAKRQAAGESPIHIDKIPLDDSLTYDLLKSCTTTAVFQLESRGMKDLIKRLQPDCFEEIIALVALFRPGPLQSGMVDDFVDRKHGRANVLFPHEKLESILKPTYGVILYQEQVMQIAQVLAGYTLGGADILRRAMGKKKPEEMAKQREIFVSGSVARGVDEQQASSIFDLMEKFAGYGFNKSHSAAYALIAYQTAWLKAHYPAEFMAAVLSSDMDNTDKVLSFIEECKDLQIGIIPPNILRSQKQFVVAQDGQILFGLAAIKGVGGAAVDVIISAREQANGFDDLFDFCEKVDTRKVNRRVIVALINTGAMDALGPNRSTLLGSLDKALQMAEQSAKNQEYGMQDLFGNESHRAASSEHYITCPEQSPGVLLALEKEALGFYLTGHPIERYADELSTFTTATLDKLDIAKHASVTIAGMVVAIRTMSTKRNDLMAFVTLSDVNGRRELAVFPELYQKSRELLEKDSIIVVEADVLFDDNSGNYRMSCRAIYSLAGARNHFGKRLMLRVNKDQISGEMIQKMKRLLREEKGDLPVSIVYRGGDAQVTLQVGRAWTTMANDSLLESLQSLIGEQNVKVLYS